MRQPGLRYTDKAIPSDSIRASKCESIRRRLGLSQRQIAQIANEKFGFYIGQATVCRIEKGLVHPTPEYLKMLSTLDHKPNSKRSGITPTRATVTQDARRRNIGVTWQEVYEAGLTALEDNQTQGVQAAK